MTASQSPTATVPTEIAEAVMLGTSYADPDGTVHPACKWLRENMPIARAELEGYDPVWLVSKHADVSAIYLDNWTFHNADHNIILYPQVGDKYLRDALGGHTHVLDNLTYMEEEDHRDHREALAPYFLPKEVRKYNPRIRELAKEFVDKMLDYDGECDFVDVVSRDFPLTTVMELITVPREDYDLMMRLTQETFGGEDPDWKRPGLPDTPEAAARSWAESVSDFYEYFEDIRKDRLANPTGDLSSVIVNARLDNGCPISEHRQNHLAATIAIAGHDTTSSALSGGMLGLCRFPDQVDLVKSDLKLLSGLADECLRYATPAKHFTRNTVAEVEFRGVKFAPMDRIMTLTVSANRDEGVFPDPERFDITRRPNKQISFGFGPHVCLGQHIAKNEIRMFFEELLPRIKTLELAGEPQYKIGNFVTGAKTMPIRFTKA